MNHKVLLADDSLTIQKVIKITLASQPFDIVECGSDTELFEKLLEIRPELVFLDFNLSDKFTGYELTSKIKAAHPSAQVLLLLGTFDAIDDQAMAKSGAADKIVKPFDSNKFISICKRLIEKAPSQEEVSSELPQLDDNPLDLGTEDQWQMSHSTEMAPEIETNQEFDKKFDVRKHLSPLHKEVSDWGMSVPGIIKDGVESASVELPPVIGEVKYLDQHRSKLQELPLEIEKPHSSVIKDQAKFPDSDDLDYPTIEELSDASKDSTADISSTSSKLISLESLNISDELEIEHVISSANETDVAKIEEQIRDEVEEDLWKVDEFQDIKEEVSHKIEDAIQKFNSTSEGQKETNLFSEELFRPLDENDELKWSTSDEQINFTSEAPLFSSKSDSLESVVSQDAIIHQLRPEIEEMVKKHVREYMDLVFQQKIEKISWEVIPDLAENLIRQELSKISSKILNDSENS